MIPVIEEDIHPDFEMEAETSRTFRLMDNRVAGFTDELEAVKQAAFLILNIERYEHEIYSWDYGIELADLYGQPTSYILAELKRRITEALTEDERIEEVSAFSIEAKGKKVHAAFTIHSIYGDFEMEREVEM